MDDKEIAYYEWGQLPIEWDREKFPVQRAPIRRVVYELDEFLDHARKISKEEFDELMEWWELRKKKEADAPTGDD